LLGSTSSSVSCQGAMRPAPSVPVRLIEQAQLGVLGAASWYLERRPRD
jgi:hypothetical protein